MALIFRVDLIHCFLSLCPHGGTFVSACPSSLQARGRYPAMLPEEDTMGPRFMNTAQAFKLRAAGAVKCLNDGSDVPALFMRAAGDRREPAHHPAFAIAQDCHPGVILTSPPRSRRPPRI